MKAKFILFSWLLYFLNNHPLNAILQFNPTTEMVVKGDGTPADANSIQNVLGYNSGYKVDSKTSKISMSDGKPLDPQAVQALIDMNLTNTIQNAVSKLNLYYDIETGNVYDADGVQVVSPQLDVVDTAVNNSITDLLNYTPDVAVKDKKEKLLMKGLEWGTAAVVGIFLIHYGVKSLRSLYSENMHDLRKAQFEKIVAKGKDLVRDTSESKQELAKASEEVAKQKERNKNIEERTQQIEKLESDNKKHWVKEKLLLGQSKVAEVIGKNEAAEKTKQLAKKEKEKRQANKITIEVAKMEKSVNKQGHTLSEVVDSEVSGEKKYDIKFKGSSHQIPHQTSHQAPHQASHQAVHIG